MMRSLILSLLSTSLLSNLAVADGGSLLKGEVKVVPGGHSSFLVSDDKRAATILFDDMVVTTDGENMIATKSVAVEIPLEKRAGGLVYVYVRGYARISPETRMALVLHCAGKVTVVDLDKSKLEDAKNVVYGSPKLNETHEKAVQAATPRKRPPEAANSFDYLAKINPELPVGDDLKVTLFLLVERRTTDPITDGAMLTVDSVDLDFLAPQGAGTAQIECPTE